METVTGLTAVFTAGAIFEVAIEDRSLSTIVLALSLLFGGVALVLSTP